MKVHSLSESRTPARDVSIDYLRAVVTLMVLAHHSSLAYTTFARFDPIHILRSTAPVVDAHRWVFLDYAENFNDVFFMSLMFLLSGLFVVPALRRHGVRRFLMDRMLRLGVPFAVSVMLLMPIAYYASWQLTGRDTGYVGFWSGLARSGFAVGPPWFIWVLLAFDGVAVPVVVLTRRLPGWVGTVLNRISNRPALSGVVLLLLAGLVYLPLLSRYGFGTWTNFITPPFALQTARIGLYALWFLVGCFVGSAGLELGMFASHGELVRRWPVWVTLCVLCYNALWFVPRLDGLRALAPETRGAYEALLWVCSNVASTLAFVAIFRGVVTRRLSWLDSLARSAYVMYLVHYVFVTWAQRSLLGVDLPASVKVTLVFTTVTALSWLTAQVAIRIPGVRNVV